MFETLAGSQVVITKPAFLSWLKAWSNSGTAGFHGDWSSWLMLVEQDRDFIQVLKEADIETANQATELQPCASFRKWFLLDAVPCQVGIFECLDSDMMLPPWLATFEARIVYLLWFPQSASVSPSMWSFKKTFAVMARPKIGHRYFGPIWAMQRGYFGHHIEERVAHDDWNLQRFDSSAWTCCQDWDRWLLQLGASNLSESLPSTGPSSALQLSS